MSTSFLGNVSVIVPATGLAAVLVSMTSLLFAVVSVLAYRPLRVFLAVRRAEARLKQLQLEFERVWWPLELLREVLAIRRWAEDELRSDVAAHFSQLTEDTLRFTWRPTLLAAVFRWQGMCARLYAAEQSHKLWEMRRNKLRSLLLQWAQDRLDEAGRNVDRLNLMYRDRETWVLHPTLPTCLDGIRAEAVGMGRCLSRVKHGGQNFDGRFGRHLMHQRSLLVQIDHLVDPPRRQASA